jgi:hypothetical protein
MGTTVATKKRYWLALMASSWFYDREGTAQKKK